MRALINAITEILDAKAALMREELRLLELGTYSRGYEEGYADVKEQFGIDVQYIQVGDDDDDDEGGTP